MKKSVIAAAVAGCLVGGYALHAEESKAPSSWADTVSLKGDMRYRFENIEQEGKEDRYRNRIRARAGLVAKPDDELEIGIRLSTGTDGDPVSSNQSLDDGFNRKSVYIDLAYLQYSPAAAEGLTLVGGKMENPFAGTDLVWDGDLNPEGVAAKYTLGLEDLDLFANAGSFWVDERSGTTDDAMLLGGQLGAKLSTDAATAMLAAGFFYYDNLKGFPTVVDPVDGFGNAVVETTDEVTGDVTETTYLYGTEIFDLVGQVGLKSKVPVTLYGDYAVNQDADIDDTGYLAGVKVGKTKAPGSVEFDYNYRELEANAVLGAFTDSDFIGGGTDGKGHKVSVGVQLTKLLKGTVTYFMNEIGLDGDSTDYDRLQVDVSAKF